MGFDDDEMPDQEDEIATIKSIRARPIDYLTAFFILLNDLSEVADRFTNMLVVITARHANYKNDQSKFADSVRTELESLPTTDKE